jgi:hypothetical protein
MPKLFIQAIKTIIVEYFENVSTINMSTLYTNSYKANIIYIGLNTVIHIFRITFMKYKNIEITSHYCRQGFLYYLEYINQISNIELQNTLNINDAITFVYSKTLTEKSESIISNIEINEKITNIVTNLSNIVNGILLWKIDLPNEKRLEIINLQLPKYLSLFSESNLERYINALPKLVDINHLDYFYKHVNRTKTKTHFLDNDINELLILDYIIESTPI